MPIYDEGTPSLPSNVLLAASFGDRDEGCARGATERRLHLLAPYMHVAASAAERSTRGVPRPTDHPRGHAPGSYGARILLVGAGPAVGWGVLSHSVALPGALARLLSELTGRGCTVDVLADPAMRAASAASTLESAHLERYDGVVVVLGVNDSLQLTPTAQWRRDLAALLTMLVRDTSAGTPIVVTGIQPVRSIALFDSLIGAIADRQAHFLNTTTEELCGVFPETVFVALPTRETAARSEDTAERHRSPAQYRRWAEIIAQPLVGFLTATPTDLDDRYARTPAREAARQQAVAALNLEDLHNSVEMQQITALARNAFGAATALVTVLDGDWQWSLATAGKPMGTISRGLSVCETTIHGAEGLIVRDALDDPRFAANPLVTGGPKIRSYAGVPVETPSGERVGALCVIDHVPRRRADDYVDLAFLRQLAHQAEGEIWRHVSGMASRDSERMHR